VQLCNIVTLCLSPVNCVPPPDSSIRYWLPSSPSSSLSVAELLRLDSWYFGLCPGLGVSSSLLSTLFYFLPWPFFLMVFSLRLPMCMSPTVSSAQSTRDDLPVILYKVLKLSPCVTILLRMGVSLWVSSSPSNGSSLDRPCSIQSRIRFCES
jgi:hypothetical protein